MPRRLLVPALGVEMYVQYGCGWNAPEGWVNFDASPTLRFERIPVIGKLYTRNKERFPANVRYGDIVKGLPIPDASCKAIYCSHILEHLSLEDFDKAVANTRRHLTEGGAFRLVVPDLREVVHDYLASSKEEAAIDFIRISGLGRERRRRGLSGCVVEWLGNSAHLWLWDEKALALKLREHGFRNIRRAHFGDSTDPMFARVERKDRFDRCLAMECLK